jgi:anthranilate synthase component 1
VLTKTLVVDGITPVGAYASLRGGAGAGAFLLESVVAGERWGRYSILGYRPRSQVVVHPSGAEDPYAQLSRLIPTGADADPDVARRFARSHVGLVAYDVVHYATKVEPWPNFNEPVARFVGDATVIVFDNLRHTRRPSPRPNRPRSSRRRLTCSGFAPCRRSHPRIRRPSPRTST